MDRTYQPYLKGHTIEANDLDRDYAQAPKVAGTRIGRLAVFPLADVPFVPQSYIRLEDIASAHVDSFVGCGCGCGGDGSAVQPQVAIVFKDGEGERLLDMYSTDQANQLVEALNQAVASHV